MRPRDSTLTAERLRYLHDYDPETGLFTRRQAGGGQAIGCVMGTTNKIDGRVRIMVDGLIYLRSRLAWLHYYGEWSKEMLDHINHDVADDRIANLRDVSRMVNMQNQIRSHTKTGLPLGVYPSKRRFQAAIKIEGKRVYIGNYKTPEEAHAAYLDVKRRHHSGNTL